LFEQRSTAIESIDPDLVVREDSSDAEVEFLVVAVAEIGVVGLVAFANVSGQGVVGTAQPAAVLTGTVDALKGSEAIGEVGVVGHRRPPLRIVIQREVIDDRTDRGPFLRADGRFARLGSEAAGMRVSGLDVVHRAVVVEPVVHGPHDGKLV